MVHGAAAMHLTSLPGRAAVVRELPRRPALWASGMILLIAVPSGDPTSGITAANVTAADVAGALFVVGVALAVLRGRDVSALRSRLLLCPVVMVAAAALSTVLSSDPAFSLIGLLRFVEIFCLIPVAVVLAVQDRMDVLLILGSVVVLGAIEGTVGMYQVLSKTGASFATQNARAVGTFGIGDQLAMATVVSLAQLVLLAVALRGGRARTRRWAGLGVALLSAPLLFSLSRGALIAVVFAAVAMILSSGIMQSARVLVAIVLLGLGAVVVMSNVETPVVERFATISTAAEQPDKSVQDRYDLWATALSMWQESPITGVGVKQFATYRDSHAPLGLSSGSDQASASTYVRVQLLSPHNEYLLLLSEQGVLGFVAFILLLLVLGARHLSRLRAPPGSIVDNVLRVAALGLLVRYAVECFYGDVAGPAALLFSVLVGLQLRSAVADKAPLGNSMRRGFTPRMTSGLLPK